MINYNFGKFVDGVFEFAKDYLIGFDGSVIMNPTDQDYLSAKYFPVVCSTANPPTGCHISGNVWNYDEESQTIVKKWIYVEDIETRQPRVFSKLKLEMNLFNQGLLGKFDELLDSVEIENNLGQKMKLRRAYELANELGEDHPLFSPYLKQIQLALGVDDQTVESILDQSVMENTEAKHKRGIR